MRVDDGLGRKNLRTSAGLNLRESVGKKDLRESAEKKSAQICGNQICVNLRENKSAGICREKNPICGKKQEKELKLKTMKKFRFIIMLLLIATAVFVQAQATQDAVYVKSGGVFRGQLIKYEQGEYVKIQLATGDIVTLPQKEIRKIIQGGVDKNTSMNRGFYYHFQMGVNGGMSYYGDFMLGLDLENTVGIQHNRWLGTGLSVGVDRYFGGEDVFFVPASLNLRGYFLDRARTPYYSLNLGYGMAVLQDKDTFRKAKGGWMWHPAFGIRFRGHSGSFTLDLGLKAQSVELEYDPESQPRRWWGRPWLDKVKKTRYYRTTLRMGWLF